MAVATVPSRAAVVRRPRFDPDIRDDSMRVLTYRLLCLFFFTLPGQGVVKIGGASTISKGAGGVLAIAAAISIAKTGRRIRWNDYIVLVLLFAGWVTLSTFWTVTPDQTWLKVATMAQLVVMVLITWEFAHTRKRLTGLMMSWIAGNVVIGGLIIGAWALGDKQTRYTAPGTHPGDQAYSLLLAIPMAWYLSLRLRRRWQVLACRLFIPFACLATLLTASRAAAISMVFALMIIPLTVSRLSPRLRLTIGAAVLVVVATAGALAAAASGPFARLSTTSSEISSGTLNHRTTLWSLALKFIGEHPLLGLGSGGSKNAVGGDFGVARGIHDTFLSIATELGLVGIGLFLLALFAAGWRALRGLPWLEQRTVWVICAVYLLFLLPRQNDYDKAAWAMMVLIAIMGSVWRPGAGRRRSLEMPSAVVSGRHRSG